MDDILVERVLRIIELVPEGRVVSYGTVGAVASCSPRYVGRIMKEYGSNVRWWTVVNAAGILPPDLLARARLRWEAEGTEHTHDKVSRAAFLTVEELAGIWDMSGKDPESEVNPDSEAGEELD